MKRNYSDFSESAKEIFDFARCQRPDGSHYPIADGLQCRKGRSAKAASAPKLVGRKKATRPTDTATRMAKGFDRNKKAGVIKAANPKEERVAKLKSKPEAKAIVKAKGPSAEKKDPEKPKLKKVELDITENYRKREAATRLIEKLPDGMKVRIDGEQYTTNGGMLKQGYSTEEASGLLRYASKVSLEMPAKPGTRQVSEKIKQDLPKKESEKAIKPKASEPRASTEIKSQDPAIKIGSTTTKSTQSSPEIKLDPKTVERNMAVAEKRALADIPKIKQEIASAKKREDETATYEAEERLGRAQGILRKIKIDREAIKSGEFDAPVRQFTQSQRDRIDARIKYLLENQPQGLYGKYLPEQYYSLIALKNSSNPSLEARLMGEEKRLKAKYDKSDAGASRQKLADQLDSLRMRRDMVSQSKEDRLKSYILSDGMVEMLKSDGNSKQNAAHKNSNALFSENGELGSSAMAKSLVKKYGGDRVEVQRGIDAVMDFTQNSYATIRRGVKDGDPTQIQRADRINRMAENLNHPAVAKYRGMAVNSDTFNEFIRSADSKSLFSDKAPSSWSTSAQIAADYTGKGGASVIFETNNKRGASVEGWGQLGEKEILTPGGTNYRHLGYRTEVHEGKPIYVFTVEELD
mgnify:CR=1 FL=1|jgi:hypothetical protein